MIAVGTMQTNNPFVILSAMLWNALYALGAFVWNLTTTTTILVVGIVAASWRPLALFAGLAAGVALAMAFWVVVVQLVGGMALIAVFALVTKRGF